MYKLIKALPVGILSAIAILAVTYLSLDADPLGGHDVTLFKGADKVAHFLMYFVTTCAFILDYAKIRVPHHTKLNLELLFTCCAMLMGLLMEVGQLLLSNGRMYDTLDIVANCLGAVTGFGYMHVWGLHNFRRIAVHSGKRHHRHHRH